MDLKDFVSHAATVLHVQDISRSLKFYTQMGFEIIFGWEEPITYAVLKLGDVQVHLSQSSGTRKPSTSLYIFVHQVDEIYDRLVANGVTTHNQPSTTDYGMREFDVLDPDQHMITFGKGDA
ncbi:MAG: VOC family protein [Cyclobacteriaceae bacterium]